MEKLVERSNIPGRVHCELKVKTLTLENFPSAVQEDLLRIAQEAISNAVRHAKPTAITVSLCADATNLVLEVADNGSGIANLEGVGRDGFGLSNMQTRAKKMGAQFEIRTVVGEGTSIAVCLPING
jgi:signal transduction histidine kinase